MNQEEINKRIKDGKLTIRMQLQGLSGQDWTGTCDIIKAPLIVKHFCDCELDNQDDTQATTPNKSTACS